MHKIILYTLFILSSLNTATMELSTEETMKLSPEKTLFYFLELVQTDIKFKELETKFKPGTESCTSQNISIFTKPLYTQPIERFEYRIDNPNPPYNIDWSKMDTFNAYLKLQLEARFAIGDYLDSIINSVAQTNQKPFRLLAETLAQANRPHKIFYTINKQTTPPTIDFYTVFFVSRPQFPDDALKIRIKLPNPNSADAELLNREIFSEQ